MKLHGFAIEHEGEITLASFGTSAAAVATRELIALIDFEPADFQHWDDCEASGYTVVPVVVDIRKTGAPVKVTLDAEGMIAALATEKRG